MARPIRIFLSYVEEDEQQIRLLYRKLSEAGYSPWMEQEDIHPGEQRDLSVKRAIRSSDFFIVCLSTHSVNTRGGVQKGIRDALDIQQEKLDDDIYIIPLRLDECEVPESLAGLQWVDWFEERGWERLLKALEIGSARRSKELEERDAEAISKAVLPPGPAASDALSRPAAWVVRVANPFSSTHPVNDYPGLFGRESELRFIFDELSKHNNVSLVGKPQIGNSSLLLVVKKIGPDRMQGLVEPGQDYRTHQGANQRLKGVKARGSFIRRIGESYLFRSPENQIRAGNLGASRYGGVIRREVRLYR